MGDTDLEGHHGKVRRFRLKIRRILCHELSRILANSGQFPTERMAPFDQGVMEAAAEERELPVLRIAASGKAKVEWKADADEVNTQQPSSRLLTSLLECLLTSLLAGLRVPHTVALCSSQGRGGRR